jgi:hypothetical protein
MAERLNEAHRDPELENLSDDERRNRPSYGSGSPVVLSQFITLQRRVMRFSTKSYSPVNLNVVFPLIVVPSGFRVLDHGRVVRLCCNRAEK